MNPIPSKSPLYAKPKIALLILIAFLFLLTPSSCAKSNQEKANSLYNKAFILYNKGNDKEALSCLEKALVLYRKLGFEMEISETLHKMGFVASDLIQYDKAMEYYAEALSIRRKLGLEKEISDTLNNMGIVASELAQYDKAMEYYDEALAIRGKLGLAEKISSTLNSMGIVASELAQYDKAMSYCSDALAINRTLGLEKETAATLNNMGGVASELAQYDKAMSYYSEALAIYKELGCEIGIPGPLYNLGFVADNLTQYDKAMAYYDEAIQITTRLKIYHLADYIKAQKALLLMKQKRLNEAKTLLEESNYLLHWGIYKLLTGNSKDAVIDFKQVSSEKEISFAELLTANIGLGLSYDSLQDHSQSEKSFHEAMDLIEKSRETTPIGERTGFFEAIDFYFPRSEAYEGLSRVLFKQKQLDESFYWSEHIKGRMLLDRLSGISSQLNLNSPKNLHKQEVDLINRIASLKKRIDAAFAKGNKELREQLESELKSLKDEQKKLIEQLRKDYPEYAAMQYPQPYHANELALKSNEVLIEYEVTDPMTIVYLIRAGKVEKALQIPQKREELEEKIKRYREPFEDVGRNWDTSSFSKLDLKLGNELYNLLLKDALTSNSEDEKVLIVPDEMLCLLPFEALVEELPVGKIIWKDDGQGPYPEGVKFVGANRVFSYWQSASSMTVVRTLKKSVEGNNLLVVADPVYNAQDARLNKQQQSLIAKSTPETDFQLKLRREVSDDAASFVGLKYFPRLEITSEFAKNLQTLYQGQVSTLMGFDATESKVKNQLSNPYGKAVIFATHGILDERVPYYQQAALVLADPQIAGEQINKNDLSSNNDGFLTMAEIMDLKIPTEIVATLACETGVGTMVGGEGVMNLGRAFQYAGARSVLISLWSVGDESTNLFGERFFSGLKNSESKDTALLATRQKLISLGYAHPFYWAPFILVGERDLSIK